MVTKLVLTYKSGKHTNMERLQMIGFVTDFKSVTSMGYPGVHDVAKLLGHTYVNFDENFYSVTMEFGAAIDGNFKDHPVETLYNMRVTRVRHFLESMGLELIAKQEVVA